MLIQEQSIWPELERFSITNSEQGTFGSFLEKVPAVLEVVEKRTRTEISHANASVLMRHAAFIYVAQLYMLCKYRMKWTGGQEKIGFLDGESMERWTPKWVFNEGKWERIENEEQVCSEIQRILGQECHSLIKSLAGLTKSSPIVLWENVWGYIIWMYGQLLQESEDLSNQANHDIELVLKDEIWQESGLKCPFHIFLAGKSPKESMVHYSRVTCCLYYMVPGNEKCSYCPKQTKDKCLR